MHDAEEPLKERIAKDENGKSIYVPGNMSYKQWLQKYHPELVDKLSENGIIKEREVEYGVPSLLGQSSKISLKTGLYL